MAAKRLLKVRKHSVLKEEKKKKLRQYSTTILKRLNSQKI